MITRGVNRSMLLFAAVLLAAPAAAQNEGGLHGELRKEADRVKEDCGEFNVKQAIGCVTTLVTDHPLHLAVGSIAPQNGFGFGLAFGLVSNRNINWPLSFNADVVGALGGAWRTGVYLKFRHTDVKLPTVGPPGSGSSPSNAIHPYPIYSVYAQGISLPTLSFFGLGPDSRRQDKSIFDMSQTIVGGSAIVPISSDPISWANLAVLGEVNGRFVNVGGSSSDKGPSIDRLYTSASAPGLVDQPGFAQFGEGVRIKPTVGWVHLNYLAQFQQFVSSSDSRSSFQRWTVDLGHELQIYRQSAAPVPPEGYGPNECQTDSSGRCPKIAPLRINGAWNKTGTVGFRFLVSKSLTSNTNAVPFYFQQTLGGSDINGNRALPSYDDYRFRGPHILLLQETFEHSLAGPIGLWLAADQGKVALQDQGLSFSDLRHSFAFGATIRAGAAPMVIVSWATGGPEGHHIAFTVNTSLLGGSSRPSLH